MSRTNRKLQSFAQTPRKFLMQPAQVLWFEAKPVRTWHNKIPSAGTTAVAKSPRHHAHGEQHKGREKKKRAPARRGGGGQSSEAYS